MTAVATGGAGGAGGEGGRDTRTGRRRSTGGVERRAHRHRGGPRPRKRAAETEPAWKGCGQGGPRDLADRAVRGEALAGGALRLLLREGLVHHPRTYEAPEVDGIKPDKLCHRIFFWLGLHTAIDEMGTAAYKTVELDDLFDGACRHHREVMTQETDVQGALPVGHHLLGGRRRRVPQGVGRRPRHVWPPLHVQRGQRGAPGDDGRRGGAVQARLAQPRRLLHPRHRRDLRLVRQAEPAIERAFAKMAADELEHARAGQRASRARSTPASGRRSAARGRCAQGDARATRPRRSPSARAPSTS